MPLDFREDNRYGHLTKEHVSQIFKTEKRLRQFLLNAPRNERTAAFIWAYDELFRQCPWHPALTENSGTANEALIQRHARTFVPLLKEMHAHTVLEIGCGNGELSLALARSGINCTGIDVSSERIRRLEAVETSNLRFLQSEATSLPFPDSSFNIVISMQLFEHLHPDDVPIHLKEVLRVLNPGGYYIIETPNRHTGPRDISRFFSDKPEGFHLREYSIDEMYQILKKNGFVLKKIIRWRTRAISATQALIMEFIWKNLPKGVRMKRSFGLGNPLYFATSN